MIRQLYLILSLLSAGCATVPEPVVEKGPAEPAFYTLRSKDPVPHTAPLPNQISIMVDWKMTDGSVVTKEGFRGWDMDHDGKFDALEVLAPDASTIAWAYDFDGDGKIDAIEKTADAVLAAAKGPAPIPNKEEAQDLLQLSH